MILNTSENPTLQDIDGAMDAGTSMDKLVAYLEPGISSPNLGSLPDSWSELFKLRIIKKLGPLSPGEINGKKTVRMDFLKLAGLEFDAYRLFQRFSPLNSEMRLDVYNCWLEVCNLDIQNRSERIHDVHIQFVLDLLADPKMRALLESSGLPSQLMEVVDTNTAALHALTYCIFDKSFYKKAVPVGNNQENESPNGIFSLEDAITFVEFRRNQTDTYETQMKERMPELLAKVERLICEAVEVYGFDISAEVVRKIIAETPVGFADPLVCIHGFSRIFGSFYAIPHLILLDSKISENKMAHNLCHELFHAISGKSFLETGSKDVNGEPNTRRSIQKLGAVFVVRDRNHKERSVFKWLNEAVTEQLTLMTVPDKSDDKYPYKAERKILEALCEKVPFSIFQSAYFENYDLEQPSEHRMAKSKELIGKINAAFGTGFLVKLDRFIKQNGVKAAYEKFFQDNTSGT